MSEYPSEEDLQAIKELAENCYKSRIAIYKEERGLGG